MDDLSPDSDSNQYDSEPSSYPPPQSVGGQLSTLNTALVDTNRNLRSIDKLMALYRNTTDRQAADMNRLKEDLHRVTSEVRLASRLGQQTPYASSPNVATAAAASSAMDPGSHMRRASSVRFLNGAGAGGAGSTEELHEVHQRLRDLGTEQSRLREELRLKPSPDEARLLREELDRVRAAERAPSPRATSREVQQRLAEASEELRQERHRLGGGGGSGGEETSAAAFGRHGGGTGLRLSESLRAALHDLTQRRHGSATPPPLPTTPGGPPMPPPPPPGLSPEEVLFRSRVDELEAAKSSAEEELEAARNRVREAEGARNCLSNELEEYKALFCRVESERRALETRIQELCQEFESKEKALRAQEERSLSTEKSRYAEEAVELRARLSTIGAPSCAAQPMRRAPRETGWLRRSGQHREAQRRVEAAERELREHRVQAEAEQERAAAAEREARSLRSELAEERNRAESRAREFQELTEAAKRDSLRLSESNSDSSSRAQRLNGELEATRRQLAAHQAQTEVMRKELENLLATTVKQESQLAQREAEADQLRQDKYQLREELNSARKDADKFRARLEERLTSAECRCSSLEEQLKSLQTEARSLQRERGELQALCADLTAGGQASRQQAEEAAKRNATLAKEKEALLRQLGQERRDKEEQLAEIRRHLATAQETARQAHREKRERIQGAGRDAADRVSRAAEEARGAEEERRLLEGLRKAQAAELERLQRSLSDRDAELAAAHGRTTAARQEAAELSAQALRLGQERSELRERLAESERRLAGLAAAGRSALEHLLRMGGAGRPRLCLDEADGGEAAADAERVGSDLALASLWALDTWQRDRQAAAAGQVREAGENRQLLRKSLSQLANVETELADLRCLLEKQRLPEQPADIDRRYRKLKDTVQGLREDLSLAERLAAKPQAAQH
uniref:Centrosomal protein of 162 kDa n=1 Tax=Macrostomum lignano TaxID=282301 RepID=A0A1I8I5C9_9PLAT